MLVRLRVKNFGIIDDFDWVPGAGFNVLTGETGAGKSLVVDAVDALMTGRLEEFAIRHGADETRLEGIFDIQTRSDVADWLTTKGIELDHDCQVVLSLNLKRGGRTTIRLNGDIVTRHQMIELGRQLVDIHGQSQHLSLMEKSTHLDFLDAYAGMMELKTAYKQEFQALHDLEKQINELTLKTIDHSRQRDYLRFQIAEIDKADIKLNEDTELENERTVLSSSEKLKELTFQAIQAIDGDDTAEKISAIFLLSQAVSALDKLNFIDNSLATTAAAVQDAMSNLTENVRDLRSYYAGLEYDPALLEEIEIRIGLIRDLKRKYGESVEKIHAFADYARNELSIIDGSDERITELRQKVSVVRQKLGVMASELAKKRSSASAKLEQAVNQELHELSMEKVQFQIIVRQDESESGLKMPDGSCLTYSGTGVDRIEFLAATNPGEPAKPLEKIASTGELSRFTLALKTALSRADRSPVLIFDEIDIGVGGRSGDIIGRKLAALALNHQVICVTHLPQIASYASHHFSVRKEIVDNRTISCWKEINGQDRVEELSLMLYGNTVSPANSAGARELLDCATDYTESLKVN
ncbi:DNA repair protein RecN [Dehalogenimonas sp. WBC-2]|nr:DNA repair protein RecN [Dehalogenimonas sp. WBC-2]